MSAETGFHVSAARVPDDLAAIRRIRQAVFIEEQGIPACLEWDGQDLACQHVLAFNPDREPVGTGRLAADGRIGRMAVLEPWRGLGIGCAMLDALLAMAAGRDCRTVYVLAQLRVAAFYHQAGFRALGQPFPEAGIEHLRMQKILISDTN